MEKIEILGVNISKITKNQAVCKIEEFLVDGKQHYVVTPNPEFLMAGQKDEEFRQILNKADLAVPDGIGLLWAAMVKSSKLKAQNSKPQLKTQNLMTLKIKLWLRGLFYGLVLMIYPKYCQRVLLERVTGVDLVWEIAKLAEQRKCSMYLVGGIRDVALACALRLKQKFPKLIIAGAEEGILIETKNQRSKTKTTNQKLKIENAKENEELILRINKARPDILLVAFGQIKQEKWIYDNLKKLPSVKLAIGVGGTFDFIAGLSKRSPKIMQKLGLEWFWRVLWQPWRYNRILTATFRFTKTVINDIIKKQAKLPEYD